MTNRIIKIAAAFLLLVSIFALGVGALSLDYSRPGSVHTKTVYADLLIEAYLKESISDAEREYLKSYGEFSLTLPSYISSSYVKTDYDEETKTLTVTAEPYVYETSDETRVEWIPRTVSLFGIESNLTVDGEKYVAVLTDVEIKDENTENAVHVNYFYSVTVSEAAFSALLNKAYFDLPRLKEEHEKKSAEYILAKEKYESDTAAYLQYLDALSEYQAALVLYENYLSEKRIYDEKYKEYLEYQQKQKDFERDSLLYAEYEKALIQFDSDYISYLYYLDRKEEYDEKNAKYQSYIEKIETVRAQLKTIEDTKILVTDLKRSTYTDIMGRTVTSVIENKTIIVNTFRVDGAVVDMAEQATENLRRLLKDYFSYTEESDKYAYYLMNYEAFRDNFTSLLRALDKLYGSAGVTDTLRSQEKEEKYVILLASLYKIVNALTQEPVYNYDNTATFDKSYKIENYYQREKKNDSYYDKYKVSKFPSEVITKEDYYVDIENPVPLETGYPKAQEKPEELVTSEPVRPEFMKKPIAPEPVLEPTPIAEVKMPIAPAKVELPSPVLEYVPDSVILDLIAMENELIKREESVGDFKHEFEISLKKQFIGAESVSVSFHDSDGNEIYFAEGDRLSPFDFYGTAPTKGEDESGYYSFIGWVDENGQDVNLASVDRDLSLYPSFAKTLKKYEITWVLPSGNITESYEYGATPKCPVIPEKSDTGSTYYTFSGFDRELLPVTGAASYTAQFKENYFITLGDNTPAKISYSDGVCTVETSTDGLSGYVINSLLSKIAGKYSLKISTRHGTVEFSFSDVLNLKNEGVYAFEISSAALGEGAYEYKLSLYSENGAKINSKAAPTLTLPCKVPSEKSFRLYYLEEDNKKDVEYLLFSSQIRFKARASVCYFATSEYSVGVIPCEALALKIDKSTAKHGEIIFVSYVPHHGIEIRGTYYVRENGEKVYFNNYFTLTESVTVGIDYKYTEYQITFISNGKIISLETYRYGEMPIVPTNPKKQSDDRFDYTFIGWSEEVGPVDSDKVYEARFWSSPIEKEEQKLIVIGNSILKMILLVGSFALILIFGGVPCLIISIRLYKKRRIRG